jgi:outer membrane protein TolC
VSVTYNLFDGGLRSAGIQRSRIGLENARLNLEQQRREVALAVETAHLELVRLDKILEISEGTLAVAGEDLKLARESYEVGQGTLLELLDAQVNFTQARSSRVRARHDLAVARANIERLLGGPSD